jgi:hypothetical protein
MPLVGLLNRLEAHYPLTPTLWIPGSASRPRNDVCHAICQKLSGISSCFLHTPRTTLILHPAPSAGTPVMTVIAWGGDGASGAGQRNPCPGRSSPRVPLPPLRAVRAGRAHRRDRGRAWLDGLPATLPGANACRCRNRSRAAERTGTEIAGGARKLRHVNIIERLGPVPRFPTAPTAAGSVL